MEFNSQEWQSLLDDFFNSYILDIQNRGSLIEHNTVENTVVQQHQEDQRSSLIDHDVVANTAVQPQSHQECPNTFETFHLEMPADPSVELCQLDENILSGANEACATQEEQQNSKRFHCDQCDKTFTHGSALKRHIRQKHQMTSKVNCSKCGIKISRRDNLKRHELKCIKKKRPSEDDGSQAEREKSRSEQEVIEYELANIPQEMCNSYDGPWLNDENLENLQVGGGEDEEEECALEQNATVFKYNPSKHEKTDLLLTLQGKKVKILEQLQKQLKKHRGIKWSLCSKVRMMKSTPEGEDQITTPHFRSRCQTTTDSHTLEEQYNEAVEKMKNSFLEYQREGSGWQLDEVLHLELNVVAYSPLHGSSYLPLPKRIKDKKAVLNIQNEDQKCFLWSVLAALHPVHWSANPQRVHHYKRHEHELNMEGVDYPVQVKQIPKVERHNNISINVFGFEDNELFPLYITKEKQVMHINLLLYSYEDKRHYCLIRNFSRLMGSLTNHDGERYYCVYCLHGFVRQDLLEDHEPRCGRHGPQRIRLPDEDHATLSFKEVQKQLKVPCIIYADFESILVPCASSPLDDNTSGTQKTQHHQPCGFGYVVVSTVEQLNQAPVIYRGQDCVDKFLQRLLEEEERISAVLEQVAPMIITEEQECEFQNATHCHICNHLLGADRVHDHCHVTGYYRGPAHNECNLNYRFSGKLPVVFHNLRGYDEHLVMQGLGKLKSDKISCIANNPEKYISFSVGNLVFIDSLQFLNSSLERLVDNLSKEGVEKFKTLTRYVEEDKVPLLLRKGVYPYEYLDSFEKFEEPQLPSIDCFFSSLTGRSVSLPDYELAREVFHTFQCQNLGDYHDLYLKSDILLLADVFENFRIICLEYYQLDPGHFFTAPGLSWAACLKMTEVELELLRDPDMYLFIEEGLRGGISQITHRYAKANNPYLLNYDSESPHHYIMYLDANNLYGWAMSQSLPVDNFGWLTSGEIDELEETIRTLPGDGTEGYILEVDLEYPQDLHNQHNDYPLAPEKLKVPEEWLSPYAVQLQDDLQMKYVPTAKLVPNLHHKEHYVLHYRNLQLYLSLGMKLTKIHRVLGFDQSPWLKTYIDFNTEKRKHARNDFEKDFFKLMNNSVFGKTMENLRKRVNVKLVNTVKQLKKLSASPLFDYFRIFDEDLVGVNLRKPSLYLNRPIYVGFAILDLSKVLMYDFHYNYIKQIYGDRAKLLFTDTDSLCYDIKTDDIYEDMNRDLDLFDTSDYPRNHTLHSTHNKKVIGKMKDETHGIPIEEFVGLRPKMYSLQYHENGCEVEKKTAKGISKNVTKRDIRHSHYRECLFNKKPTINNMKQLRSFKHQIYTLNMNKIGLSPYDDKRYISEDGVTTLAYGHYFIT